MSMGNCTHDESFRPTVPVSKVYLVPLNDIKLSEEVNESCRTLMVSAWSSAREILA